MKFNSVKIFYRILILTILTGLGASNGNANVLFRGTPEWVFLDGNTVRSYIWDSGIFDQDPTTNNSPGFEWPKGSGKYSIFTAGLTVAAYVNGELRMAANSFSGELGPGYIVGGVPTTNPDFKIYRVNDWDNCQSNPDYANWGLMIPYGAPYVDINHNGQYDDCIDKPGIRLARQTVFVSMTDGFPGNHNSSEGFGGGTAPLNADFRLTAWCYNSPGLETIQFLKWDIINQNNLKWDSVYFGIISDMDLGEPTDDYIGFDSTTGMGYCYNSDNNDGSGTGTSYGLNPPSSGLQFLKTPNDLGVTSFVPFENTGSGGVPCEQDPQQPIEAYNYLQGYKRDKTPWLNPETTPAFKTKFCFPGRPGGPGWNEFTGVIHNCGGDTTGSLQSSSPGDRRIVLSSGSTQLSMNPGDTQTVSIGQHVARGTDNINSVTKLLLAAEFYRDIYMDNFEHSVSGTIRYGNGDPVQSGYVKALKVDGNTGEVQTVDSTIINSNGAYTLTRVPFIEVDIMAYPSSELEDFVPTYYPSTTSWQLATSILTDTNITNLDVSVISSSQTLSSTTNATIQGKITGDSLSNTLNDAIVYLKDGNTYYSFDISSDSGMYQISPTSTGFYKVFVDRLGFTSDSIIVNVASGTGTYDIDFNLHQLYVGITTNTNIIPDGYELFQNYPNPFNPSTKIKFHIGKSSNVRLSVFDITGREVATLVNSKLNPGEFVYEFNASNLPSGVYFYSIITEDFRQTKKMVLLK